MEDRELVQAVRAWQLDQDWAKGKALGGWSDELLGELFRVERPLHFFLGPDERSMRSPMPLQRRDAWLGEPSRPAGVHRGVERFTEAEAGSPLRGVR